MPTQSDESRCWVCGQGFADGEPRYRRPEGDVHVRCFEGPRVLVVEDDTGLRELLADAIRRERRCQVHAVANGRDALERIRGGQIYDLILCDLRMPEMSGPGFYRALRTERPNLAARVVFMTAYARGEEYAAFMEEIHVPVLRKPFSKEDLDGILAAMIGPAAPAR